jgi:hypothetical protein
MEISSRATIPLPTFTDEPGLVPIDVYVQDNQNNEEAFNARHWQLIGQLRAERTINQRIADADPLGADVAIAQLPQLNVRRDIAALIAGLQQLIVAAQQLPFMNYVTASAAIRDICMYAGSLTSFGLEPCEHVLDFASTLLSLSFHADDKIPRDSFIDYTSRNPIGARARQFTALDEERLFIESLRSGMDVLDSCVEHMLYVYYSVPGSPDFVEHCNAAANAFQTMIDSMVIVKRAIPTETFTHYIRPYFEPFKVNDHPYSAPSGAEMSILNIDQMLWGADCYDQLYRNYFTANIIRLPAVYRQISQLFTSRISLMTRLSAAFRPGQLLRPAEQESMYALHRFLTKIYSFRMPHYKVAEDNVKLRLRETQGEQAVKGSSGFGLDEVKYVLDQTIKWRNWTGTFLQRAPKAGLTSETRETPIRI